VKSLFQYLNESKADKNLHLEHLEDMVFDHGIDGARASINFLRSIRDMLASGSLSSMNLSVKWDGAPAIFAGTDPADGKFFVGTKGVFAQNPKLIKSNSDLDKFGYSGGLADKLKVALKELSKLGIDGVIQGDMMYTSDDLSTETIDGKSYVTFQPNTIVYAVEANSSLAKEINASKMGIVFHTTYTGDVLADMKASIGVDIKKLAKTKSVWFDDAQFKDVSGTITLTADETKKLGSFLSAAGTAFRKINSRDLKAFLEMQNSLGGASGSGLKTFNNTKVRAGEKISDPKKHSRDYLKYFSDWHDKKIGEAKTDKTKENKEAIKQKHLKVYKKSINTLAAVLEFQNHVVDAKLLLVNKLSKTKGMTSTFVKTKNGFRITSPEGYVAVDRDGNMIKLVDRLEFSHQNFTAIKNWDS
jgi:hypothetical protein